MKCCDCGAETEMDNYLCVECLRREQEKKEPSVEERLKQIPAGKDSVTYRRFL